MWSNLVKLKSSWLGLFYPNNRKLLRPSLLRHNFAKTPFVFVADFQLHLLKRGEEIEKKKKEEKNALIWLKGPHRCNWRLQPSAGSRKSRLWAAITLVLLKMYVFKVYHNLWLIAFNPFGIVSRKENAIYIINSNVSANNFKINIILLFWNCYVVISIIWFSTSTIWTTTLCYTT